MESCSVDEYMYIVGVYQELIGTEKRLDAIIHTIQKKDNLHVAILPDVQK